MMRGAPVARATRADRTPVFARSTVGRGDACLFAGPVPTHLHWFRPYIDPRLGGPRAGPSSLPNPHGASGSGRAPTPTRNTGKPKRSKGRNLFKRLQRCEDGVLGFAFEANTPFTNHQTERDLRPAKVKQKVSSGFPHPSERSGLRSSSGTDLDLSQTEPPGLLFLA